MKRSDRSGRNSGARPLLTAAAMLAIPAALGFWNILSLIRTGEAPPISGSRVPPPSLF